VFVAFALDVRIRVIRGSRAASTVCLVLRLSSVVKLLRSFAAVCGLGLNYAAYYSEIYRAALEAIPPRNSTAARKTLGHTRNSLCLGSYAVPQACVLALAPMTNDFVAAAEDSSARVLITVVDLTNNRALRRQKLRRAGRARHSVFAALLAFSLPLS